MTAGAIPPVILHRTTIAFKVEILSFSVIVPMSDSER